MGVVEVINLEVINSGDRLDRWLTEQLVDLSRARIQRIIDQGLVILNGQVVTEKKTKLKLGDRLSVTIPEPESLDVEA